MEGSGMFVFETYARTAVITQDPGWNLELIKDWELPTQQPRTFKSVVAIAVQEDSTPKVPIIPIKIFSGPILFCTGLQKGTGIAFTPTPTEAIITL